MQNHKPRTGHKGKGQTESIGLNGQDAKGCNLWSQPAKGPKKFETKGTGRKSGAGKAHAWFDHSGMANELANTQLRENDLVAILRMDGTGWFEEESSKSVHYVGCAAAYSWDQPSAPSQLPCLHIPGAPRCHFPGNMGEEFKGRVMERDGVIIKDENHYRLSCAGDDRFPTEPMFVALTAMKQGELAPFRMNEADPVHVICDSNTLCKLVAWMKGESSRVTVSQRNQRKDVWASFTFDVDVVAGETLVLTRVEDFDVIPPQEGVGTFGPAFERLVAPLPNGFETCNSFYRISLVQIGGLRAYVRVQVDAVKASVPDNDLAFPESAWKREAPSSLLQWKLNGLHIALHGEALELKTSSAKTRGHNLAWEEWYGQMLFRGAATLLLGYHKEGEITRPPVYIPFADVAKRAGNTREVAPRLEPLLRKILELVKQFGCDGSVSHGLTVHCDGRPGASLEVLKKTPGNTRVPDWVAEVWPI